MKKLTNLALITFVCLIGLQEAAATGNLVPEIDTSSAALGLGLMVGLVTLISEHRRK